MPTQQTRAVLVTGAADRLGLATARALAQAGHHVVLHANGQFARAQAHVAELVALGHRAQAIQADLRDRTARDQLIARASELCGRPIDGLVNNASVFENDGALDFSDEAFDRHFDVHVRAPCILARNLALGLPEGVSGAVVNVIDQRVFKLTPQFFTYTLSKAALATATKTLAQALAPQVRVNGVAPGPILRNSRQDEASFQKQVDATLLRTGSPIGDVVAAILWLLDAGAVTGQVLAVDGGQSLIWETPDVVGIVE
ncbi:MAG: hypothetical protein RLZZ157_676 [Pseudomonadota bacterium]|jgi:NAD(P)-dependent dehydrogenase (short-subunit alcohol dehydrogenase family)